MVSPLSPLFSVFSSSSSYGFENKAPYVSMLNIFFPAKYIEMARIRIRFFKLKITTCWLSYWVHM